MRKIHGGDGKMKKLIFLLLIALLIVPLAQASVIGKSCSGGKTFDIESQEQCHQETNFNIWAHTLADSSKFLMESVKASTTGYKDITEDTNAFNDIKSSVKNIASLIILLAITYAGTLYIVSGTDPKKRFGAKKQLIAFVYMIIFANIAFYLAGMVYDVSVGATWVVESDNTQDFMNADPWQDLIDSEESGDDADYVQSAYNKFSSLAVATPILLISGWAYVLLMYLRNMLVILLTVFAPLIVVLFFFQPTKAFGKVLAILYVVELFLPVLFFPVFAVADKILGGDYIMDIGIMASALAVAVVLHLVLVGVAIMRSSQLGISSEEVA